MNIARRDLLCGGAAGALLPGAAGSLLPEAARRRVSLGIARDIQGRLDPAARLGAIEGNIIRAVCPGLVESRAEGAGWRLALARELRVVSDTAIAFELRADLRFHAGYGEVTAPDVAFSFERFGKPGPDGAALPYAGDWAALDGVEVTGERSGVIHLRHPAPAILRSVLPDVSGCIISRRALEDGAYRLDRDKPLLVGAGNWRFVEWRPNQAVLLQRDGPGSIRQIALRPVREARTAELALRGDALQFAAVPPADLGMLRRVQGLGQIDRPAQNLVWIGINVAHAPFDDARVRRAIGLALDVEQLVQGAWDGAAVRADAAIPPGLPGHWEAAPVPRRDVATARALLAEAGQAGLRARLLLLARPDHQAVGVIAQAMLAEAGIRLELDIRDEGAFWSSGFGQPGEAVQLALQRFGGKPDPGFLLQWFTFAQIGGWNWQRWHDAEFDALLDQAAATPDGAVRAALYVRAQMRMAASGAFLFLTHEQVACGFRDWLRPAVLGNGEDWLLDDFAA